MARLSHWELKKLSGTPRSSRVVEIVDPRKPSSSDAEAGEMCDSQRQKKEK